MVKEIIYIMEIKEYIKEIGKMARNKDLGNQLLMISMDTRENGNKIKKMAKAHIYIRMERDMKVVGPKTKKMEKEYIDIEMGMFMKDCGKMIEGKVKEQ